MNKFYFNGEIVSRDCDKTTIEDITPYDIQQFISGLNDGEEIELYFNSFGGDCFSALQICSMLKDAEKNGHKTIANITSCACSSASFIACVCSEINLYEGCYIMVHLPWTVVQGNAMDLEKEIATLEQMKNTMVKIYRTKFNLPDDEICTMLENETWIDSDNYGIYKLDCKVIKNDTPVRISASIKNKRFNNLPKGIFMEDKNIEETVETVEEEKTQEQVEDTQTDEKKTIGEEETKEEKIDNACEEQEEEKTDTPFESDKEDDSTVEGLKARIAELEEQLKKYETESVEDRVRGMQSKMQARINTITTDFTAKINDFETQLKAKNEELETVKNESISLKNSLEKTSKELEETLSALNDKAVALAQLNSSVLAKPETPISYKDGLNQCKTPEERIAYIRSGNYTI